MGYTIWIQHCPFETRSRGSTLCQDAATGFILSWDVFSKHRQASYLDLSYWWSMFKTWCTIGIIGMLQCVNKLSVLYMCLYMQISASKTREVCFDEHPDMSKKMAGLRGVIRCLSSGIWRSCRDLNEYDRGDLTSPCRGHYLTNPNDALL